MKEMSMVKLINMCQPTNKQLSVILLLLSFMSEILLPTNTLNFVSVIVVFLEYNCNFNFIINCHNPVSGLF